MLSSLYIYPKSKKVASSGNAQGIVQDRLQGTFFQQQREQKGMALAYRLLAAQFTQTSAPIDLGAVTLEHASSMILLATVNRVTPATHARFTLTDQQPLGQSYGLQENRPAALPDTASGIFTLQAHLTGSTTESPVVYCGIQLAQAALSEMGDYVTRAIAAGNNACVTIVYEEAYYGGDDDERKKLGNVTAFVEVSPDNFQEATLKSTRSVEADWVERVHGFSPLNRSETRIKLVLRGNARCRTAVRRLRVVVT